VFVCLEIKRGFPWCALQNTLGRCGNRALEKKGVSKIAMCRYVSIDFYLDASFSLCVCVYLSYGVTTISRLLKIIGLFCKRALRKRL